VHVHAPCHLSLTHLAAAVLSLEGHGDDICTAAQVGCAELVELGPALDEQTRTAPNYSMQELMSKVVQWSRQESPMPRLGKCLWGTGGTLSVTSVTWK